MPRRTSLRLRCGALLLAMLTQSPLCAAAQLTLRDEQLAHTPEGRELLKYLVSCALPSDVTVVTTVSGQHFSFAGGMALAPAWSTRALTPTEERRVSACMLARTNYFGTPVQISLRSNATDAPASLAVDENERRNFPFFEGGFFGNLFKDEPESYVCSGDMPAHRAPHLENLLRVCSLPMTGNNAVSDVSRCRFIMTGTCENRQFVRNGVDYSADIINVYLPALKP